MRKQRKVWQIQSRFSLVSEMQWARFMQCVPDTKNIFFGKEGVAEDQKKRGYIVITADKGLAGAYNHNVLKLASEEIEKHPQR